MIAFQPLPPLIPRDLECDPILWAELFEFGHHAGGEGGEAGGVEGVHQRWQEGEFVVDRVREEVGVEEDAVGGLEGGVVVEEHGAWDLWARRRGVLVVGIGWRWIFGAYTSRINSLLCSLFFFLLVCSSFLTMFFFRRASRCPMMRLTVANLRVRFWTPMVYRARNALYYSDVCEFVGEVWVCTPGFMEHQRWRRLT